LNGLLLFCLLFRLLRLLSDCVRPIKSRRRKRRRRNGERRRVVDGGGGV